MATFFMNAAPIKGAEPVLLERRAVALTDELVLNIVRMPGGRFLMGDSKGSGQKDERPVRNVSIEPFWATTRELSVGAFTAFVEATGYQMGNSCWVYDTRWIERVGLNWRAPGYKQEQNHPVVCVTWHDAQAFIKWARRTSGIKWRLPSEAEWEFAARGGSTGTYYWGEEIQPLCEHANAADKQTKIHHPTFAVNDCDDGYYTTSPTGAFLPNPWGLYDVYGNVWEWVEDCWNSTYRGAPDNGSPWLTGDCTRRGFRGGGWGDIPRFARSSIRNRSAATSRKDDIGFRLVVSDRALSTERE
ncbi:MAG: formylglycine-generating enzyme family protein [Pseudomonadota bacterium]